MKILVTGATGFLGQHLVNDLSAKGIGCIALGRNQSIGAKLANKSTEFINVDLTDKESVLSIDKEVDIIVHCAALSTLQASAYEYHQHNVIATENIVALANKRNIKRFIHISSASVYFEYKHKLDCHEDTDIAVTFVNDYAKTKFQSEQVLESSLNPSIERVILRPRGIFGEGDNGIMPRILRVAKSGFFPLINKGQAELDITYVKNVSHAIMLAATVKQLKSTVFNITNDEPTSLNTLLNAVFSKKKITVKMIHVPQRLLMCTAYILAWQTALFSKTEPKLLPYSAGLLTYSQTLNIDRIKLELGYKPLYTITEGIVRYAKQPD